MKKPKINVKQVAKGTGIEQQVVVNNYYGLSLSKEQLIDLIQDYGGFDGAERTTERLISCFAEAYASVDPNNRKKPDKRVFVPTFQQLSYSLDDEMIKNAYKNLLKASMDSTKSVHPSYSSIIAQLNSDEIKLLNVLPLNNLVSNPLINLRTKPKQNEGQGLIHVRYFTNIGFGVCDHPENICSYLENLERLKLIEIPPFETIINKEKYKPLEEHPLIQEIIKTLPGIVSSSFEELLFRLTSFGVEFIKTCKG